MARKRRAPAARASTVSANPLLPLEMASRRRKKNRPPSRPMNGPRLWVKTMQVSWAARMKT